MAQYFSRLAKGQSAIWYIKPDLDHIFHGDPGCGQLCGYWSNNFQRIAGTNGHYSIWRDFFLADLSTNFLPSRDLLKGSKGLEVINVQHPVNESNLPENQPVYLAGTAPQSGIEYALAGSSGKFLVDVDQRNWSCICDNRNALCQFCVLPGYEPLVGGNKFTWSFPTNC